MLPGTKAPATYNFAIPLDDLIGRDKELHQRLVEFNKRRMGSSLMFSNQETTVLSVTGVNAVLAEMENRWHSNFQPTYAELPCVQSSPRPPQLPRQLA